MYIGKSGNLVLYYECPYAKFVGSDDFWVPDRNWTCKPFDKQRSSHLPKGAFTPADSDWIWTETGLGSDFGLRSHQTGLALDFPRICDVRGQLYFNFCFTGAHCCPLVQWTTTSPWQPVHFQSEVSPIAFTFAWVRSELFPSPPRLGGLKSCPNWVQIQSKSSPSPLVWTHLKFSEFVSRYINTSFWITFS